MQRIVNNISGILVELLKIVFVRIQSEHDNDHYNTMLPRRLLPVQTLTSVEESDPSASHGVFGRPLANLVDVRIVKHPLNSS